MRLNLAIIFIMFSSLSAVAENITNLIADEIKINQADENGATPLIIATYLGRFSTVQLLLSNNKIDASILFEEKTAAQYSESTARVPSWSFLDNEINQEGRTCIQCHQLFSSFQNELRK